MTYIMFGTLQNAVYPAPENSVAPQTGVQLRA